MSGPGGPRPYGERLAGVLGHELRNPLAAAVTGAALLGELIDDGDPRRTVLDRLLRDLDRVTKLANAYLAFGGTGALARADVDAAALVRDVAARHGASADGGGACCTLRGDAALLERALENLVENARQAGARDVRLRAVRRGESVLLVVEDDGRGVDPAIAARLFEPGVSGHGGTGLGLAIVAATAKAHGGTVRCEPRARGAAFVLELPRAGDASDAAKAPATPPAPSPSVPAFA